jgi:precorrin-6y C5,15-methyltransferase (decarboxylating) CbiE subunit
VLASAGLNDVWDDVAERVVRRARERLARRRADREGMRVDCAVVAYNGEVLGRSAALRAAPAAADGVTRLVGTRPAAADARPATLSLTVVGTGPGGADWLPSAAWRAIRGADVVVGGRRQLASFAPPGVERVVIGADMNELAATLRLQSGRRVVVLASGDPGFYGIAATLRRLLPVAEIVILPGISSVQLAAARLGRSWHDVHFASAHGTELAAVISAVRRYERVFALTDAANTPQALAAALADVDADLALTVLERLGLPDERITGGSPAAIAAGTFAALAVVFIEHEEHE